MTQILQVTSINQEELGVLIKNSVAAALQGWEPPVHNLPEYCTRKEAAALLRVALPTIDEYIKKGLIEGSRIGSRVRIKRSEIEKAMAEIKNLRYKRA